MKKNNPYWTDLARHLCVNLSITLTQSEIELAYMISKWAYSNLLQPTDEKCVDLFHKLNANTRLRSYMLGVAPGCLYGSGLLLRNIVSCINPYYEMVTDEGCRIIYEYCYGLMANIPITSLEPSIQNIYEAAAALREFPSAIEAADDLYNSIQDKRFNARSVCSWASRNSSKARYILELTNLLCGCAYESPASIASNISLCALLANEFGDNIYTPVD